MELQSCPFCGESPNEKALQVDAPSPFFVIACRGCGAYGPWGGTDAAAANKWNDHALRAVSLEQRLRDHETQLTALSCSVQLAMRAEQEMRDAINELRRLQDPTTFLLTDPRTA